MGWTFICEQIKFSATDTYDETNDLPSMSEDIMAVFGIGGALKSILFVTSTHKKVYATVYSSIDAATDANPVFKELWEMMMKSRSDSMYAYKTDDGVRVMNPLKGRG